MKLIYLLAVMIGLTTLGANAQTVTGSSVMDMNDVPVVVNCDQGQSLNSTLSRLEKRSPVTVLVTGTCTEFVLINGFEGLTLKACPVPLYSSPARIQATDSLSLSY